MIAVLTGDIVHSRSKPLELWSSQLTKSLLHFGDEGLDWETFQGDSFELRIDSSKAILAAFYLKAGMKSLQLDVRIAIGLGTETLRTPRVSNNSGTAYFNSGATFKLLKGNEVIINSGSHTSDFNFTIHLFNQLTEKWTPTVANIIQLAIENPTAKQVQLAEKIDKSQRYISETLKQGYWSELNTLQRLFNQHLKELE